MNKLLAATVPLVATPVFSWYVVALFLPDSPGRGEMNLILAVLILLVVTAWVVGPLGAWRRWWPSTPVYALCSGSLTLLLSVHLLYTCFGVE